MDPPSAPAAPAGPPQGSQPGNDAPNLDTETNAPRMASPRQRGSIPSFIFMSFLLFMLTNHNSENFLARTQYQDALESLAWQMGNYSAWLNDTQTNFTMVSDMRFQFTRQLTCMCSQSEIHVVQGYYPPWSRQETHLTRNCGPITRT